MKNDKNNLAEKQSKSWAGALFLFLAFFIALAFWVRTSNDSTTLSYFGTKDYVKAEIKVKGVQLKVYQDLGE